MEVLHDWTWTWPLVELTIAYGWSHMQKQAPQTKERTKVESHANIMFGPQLKSFMRILNCFRFQKTCARSSQFFLPEHTHHVEHFEDLKTTFITEEI